MAITAFTTEHKTNHNSHKFGFKLSPTNYGFWKTMIQPFLITNDLFGYIDGSIPCPSKTVVAPSSANSNPTTNPNSEFSAWISNDAHIRMLLLSMISEASFKHVQGDTSRELWLALKRAYAPHTSSREYTLKTQLLKIEMKPEETSSDYLTRVQEYSDALTNIGEPMKEKDVVMLAISGLREEYNSLKPTLISRQPSVTLLELPSLLVDHEYMVKKTEPAALTTQAFMATSIRESPSLQLPTETLQSLQKLLSQLGLNLQPTQQPNQALHTTRANPNRGSYNRRGRGRYNNNNQNSRPITATTGNTSRFAWESNQNTVYGSCNMCGIGHIPSLCLNRDPTTIRTPRQAPQANFADQRSQASSSKWLPDTGASSHVSPDLYGFDESEPYHGIGYNGFPRGCSDDKLPWSKKSKNDNPLETKYPYVCHAEVNCILNTNHASAAGQRLYVTMFPCNECAKVIIQSGVSEVVYFVEKSLENSDVIYAASHKLLSLAGVKVRKHQPRMNQILLRFLEK